MKTSVEKKLAILQSLTDVPFATAQEIAEVHDVSISNVAGIKAIYNKRGIEYITKLRGKLPHKSFSGAFLNFEGDGKLGARERMFRHIQLAKLRCGKILTLPSTEWKMERMLNQISKRFNYIACENNPECFKKMVAKSDWYGTNNVCHQTSVGNFIFQAKEDEYSHLLLDYCGKLETFQKEIKYACENKIVKKGGIIAVTLYRTRSKSPMISKLNQLHSDMSGQHIEMNDNTNAVKMFFHCLSALTEFEVVEEFTYHDSSPMILVILKRR